VKFEELIARRARTKGTTMKNEASDGDGVRVEHDQGTWTVIVTENGIVSEHVFDNEEETSAFAVAQRMRLGQPEPKAIDLA
jgi:hypothetical protein